MALQCRLRRVEELNKDERGKLLEDVKTCVTEAAAGPRTVGLALEAGHAAESSGDTAWAAQLFTDLGKTLSGHTDKRLARTGAMLEGAARRLGLVGQEMTVAGKTSDGEAFDGAKYKGKVVLVDFFATWCGPCRAELPNIEKYYKAYHDRGFEVVAVSIDRDRKSLDKYLQEQKHPWTVLVDDPAAGGSEDSLSVRYGIFAVPQMILVGPDGKVVSLKARGQELGTQLEKLLGPAEVKKPEAKTGIKPAPQL